MEMNDFYGKDKTLYRIGVCMKRKKLSTLLALVLGVTALSGCTNSDQKVNFGNFWVTDVLNTNAAIQETLSYDVTFNKGENSLVNYEIDYKDGTYTTALVGAKENDKIVRTERNGSNPNQEAGAAAAEDLLRRGHDLAVLR